MSFEQLLNDLEVLRKSQAIDEEGQEGAEKIIAAAADGEGEGNPDAKKDDGEQFGKSMTAIIDGQEQEVIDGTEFVKALHADVESIKASRETENGQLAKAMTSMTEMLGEQGKLIKSLQDQIAALSNSGAGRKSTLGATDADLTKSMTPPADIGRDAILAKCEAAMSAGKLTGMDVSIAEAALNRGMQVPGHIMAALS